MSHSSSSAFTSSLVSMLSLPVTGSQENPVYFRNVDAGAKKGWAALVYDLSVIGVTFGLSYWMVQKVLVQMGKTTEDESQGVTTENDKSRITARLSKLRNKQVDLSATTTHENVILKNVILPDELRVSMDDIGGLKEIKAQLWETILMPLQHPEIFRSSGKLLTCPRGCLFYGPSGTGKSMLAKAIAKESTAAFINVSPSTFQNKWFGESQKYVRALFTLANKLSPCIIFIDEIDLFLSSRDNGNAHEASNSMKGEFMALWDGLTTSEDADILVLGATNRPWDIDTAFLRRMPRQFQFTLPSVDERKAILHVILRDCQLHVDVCIEDLAKRTQKYSGSDLKEFCKYAAMLPMREWMANRRKKTDEGRGPGLHMNMSMTSVNANQQEVERARPIRNSDFEGALKAVRPTGEQSVEEMKRFSKANTKFNF